MQISIIVPVYNTSKYLRKCLDSIIEIASLKKEIILINDGSNDNSLEIINEYKVKYSKEIKVINQKNQGLSATRNLGIQISTGNVIAFIDSDDFIDAKILVDGVNFFEKEDLDILCFGITDYKDEKFLPRKIIEEEFLEKTVTGLEYIDKMVVKKNFYIEACCKLYRRNFLIENKIFFQEKLIHEDNLFAIEAFIKATKVRSYSEIYYFYRRDNEQSITNNKTKENMKHIIYIINRSIDHIKSLKLENKGINRIIITMYLSSIVSYRLKSTFTLERILKINNFSFREKIKIAIIIIFSKFCKEENF